MVPLAALWLPILLSAVIVFVASFVMHIVLSYHHSDYSQLPDEDNILATLRAAALKRGLYIVGPWTRFTSNAHTPIPEPRKL